jgi:hypothetical protein
MISETFCAAPWTVHCINADGTAGVCCVNSSTLTSSNDHAGLINGTAVRQMKLDMLSGKPAVGCEKCYDHEAAGVYSLRNLYNDLTADVLDQSKLSKDDYENRTWYDLSLSNKCNQKCRICGPYNSTAWAKDAAAVADLKWTHVNWRELDDVLIDSSSAIPGILASMQAATSPFRIELKGGEPLYMESSRELISSMIRLGLHERTEELRIITNGTQHDERLLEMLSVFPAIDMALSIDATGKLHEYTRGTNMTWDECRRSWAEVTSLPNIKRLRISNTVYAYTIFDLPNLRQWAAGEFGRNVDMADAMLHKPRYLHAKILPQALRDRAVALLPAGDDMIAVISGQPTTAEFGNKQPLEVTLQQLRSQFKIFTERMDSLRRENLLDIVPELSEMLS